MEVLRSLVACAGGLDATRLIAKLQPEWRTQMPDGFDLCSIPKDVLKDYHLATQSVSFAPAGAKKAELFDGDDSFAQAIRNADTIGSNNWTVSGKRTATGRPILGSDPHRAHSVPSLRYIVQLNAPGLNVIGAGEPALPGISIGHNDKIAFGLTIFPVNQEDLYVEALNPDNPNQYRFGNGWEDIRTIHEMVEVKGEAPRDIEMQFTRHGPVLATDPANHRAFSMRSVWFEPGTSAYFGSSDYMTAQNWNEFLATMRRWGAPSENQVYADTAGNIGWIPGGMAPRRLTYDGLWPVPGDGRYECGRSSAGAKAAVSHTGALAGADLVYDAAFRRAGMLRVKELGELFEAVTTLSAGIQVKGDRLTVVTNGGGAAGSRRFRPRHLRNSIASCRGHGRGETRSTFSATRPPNATAARSRRFSPSPRRMRYWS